MSDDFNNKEDSNIEDEIAKSLEKMVEEETNVAKAFVDNHKPVKTNNIESDDAGKTRVIPKITDDMLAENAEDSGLNLDGLGIEEATLDGEDDNITRKQYIRNDNGANRVRSQNRDVQKDSAGSAGISGTAKKPMDKKTKLTIAGLCAGVAVVILVIILIAVNLNNSNKKSYKYNYNKGMEYYDDKEYSEAVDYLKTASKTSEGKKNVELKYALAVCYEQTGETESAIDTLKDLLSYNDKYENAVKMLAKLYSDEKDGTSLTTIVNKYKGTSLESCISQYAVDSPKASKDSGSYDDSFDLTFTAGTGCKVYYTIDGTQPTTKSMLYDSSIEIVNGTTTIKAIAVSSIGVVSDTIELKYVVEYGKPSAPDITPASGTYEAGQKITINNIPENSKCYYTLDGTTPTKNSTEYSGEFGMPEGNTVVSAIIIDSHDQLSSVTKRNYVINKATTYNYDQSLTILKTQLIADGVITSEDKTTAGKTVTFGYETKTKVSGVEMQVIKFTANSKDSYYGVDVSTGKIYTVTKSGSNYTAVAYK